MNQETSRAADYINTWRFWYEIAYESAVESGMRYRVFKDPRCGWTFDMANR